MSFTGNQWGLSILFSLVIVCLLISYQAGEFLIVILHICCADIWSNDGNDNDPFIERDRYNTATGSRQKISTSVSFPKTESYPS